MLRRTHMAFGEIVNVQVAPPKIEAFLGDTKRRVDAHLLDYFAKKRARAALLSSPSV